MSDLLNVVERAQDNLLQVEDYLARERPGEGGGAELMQHPAYRTVQPQQSQPPAIGSAAVSATLAQPAMAAHPKDTCPGNTLCEWADANFEGPVKWWGRSSRIDNYRLYFYDSNTSVPMDPNGPHGTAHSNVSSVWNNTDRWVTLCNNWYCNSTGGPDTEFGICLGPDKAISYLGVNGSGWNDVLSSHRTGTAPDHCAYWGSQEGCSL